MDKRLIGSHYERIAASFLEQRGYTIVQRNYQSSTGEIDLIAKENEYLVFIEVKYRQDARYGYPTEAVTRKKQQKIYKTAQCFIKQYGINANTPCRFDVVSIQGSTIRIIRNAFGGL